MSIALPFFDEDSEAHESNIAPYGLIVAGRELSCYAPNETWASPLKSGLVPMSLPLQ